jgi:hypothetical protein
VLEQSASFTGQIVGFTGDGTAAHSDIIDLRGVDFAKAQESYAQANGSESGTLTVGDGQTAVHINFQGTYVSGNFVLANDGNGGTLVIDPPVTDKASTASATQAHLELLHLSDNFDFADGIDHAGLNPTLVPHFGGTLTEASASAAHLQLDSFDFGRITPVNFQPVDLGKLAALPDLPALNDWQQLLVHAATGAQDSPSAAVAGTVSSEASAGHPNSHFMLHA